MKITGNEPAMPHPNHEGRSGLSIRQQFAMAAMQANRIAAPNDHSNEIAFNALKDADALIAELNKSEDEKD